MNTREALKIGILSGQSIAELYLSDFTDSELLVRPVPGANHVAWQLGHLLKAEHDMMEMIRPKSMPELPAGFAEAHKKEASVSDDPRAFLTKSQYFDILKKQHAGTLALLETMSDAQLDQPAPEPLRHFLNTVGQVFSMQGTHWVMHAGQWAVTRRKLGEPVLF
ncbi:MAG: DinB family protein [Pirellulales bacterium]